MNKYLKALTAVLLMAALAAGCAGKKPATGKTWDLDQQVAASYAAGAPAYDGRLQVIAYNIERGFFFPDVVKYIEKHRAELPATVVLLSECDRNHSRTHDVFVADEMARALGMDMVFVTEFIEYNDETKDHQGDHGNAILSPFPLSEITVIRHSVIFSWSKFGYLMGEPRYGNRVTVGATVQLPDGKRLRVYTAHLESHAGTIGKWIQISEILADVKKHNLPAVIGGDFNEPPFGLMFALFPFFGIHNTFAGDLSPTGSCKPQGDHAKCSLKIDWIVDKDLKVVKRSVDYPLNREGGVISDHAPVRAVFALK